MTMTTTTEWVARAGAGIEGLFTREVAIADPGPGEVLVRLTAATLNYRDLIGVRGGIPGMTKDEYVPLSCACGVVVGAGVTRVAVGQRVSPLFAQGWLSGGLEEMTPTHLGGSVDGVARSHALFPEHSLSLVPDELSDLEAATVPCAGLTAWSCLFAIRHTRPGDVVVLQGTGGVSIAALQLAKAAGAEVIITSSSDAKLARAGALGADHLINYRGTPAWEQEVLAITGGRGAHLLVDVVGGSALASAVTALRDSGVVAGVGMLGGEFSWGREARVPVRRVAVGNREQFETMLRALAVNRIRPVVDRVYPLARLPEALDALARGDFFAKIAVTLS